jgi:DNA mismatch repair protein MutS2
MDRYSQKKLEFHKIKEMLEACCHTPLGVPHVQGLEPSADAAEIRRWQEETSEAATLLRILPDLGFEGIADLISILRRASIGGVLEPRELLLCRQTLVAAGRIRHELARVQFDLPHLQEYAAKLQECRPLQEKIAACILPEGEIADGASPDLARLRQQIRSLENRARNQLDDVLTRPEWQKYLQEPIYTVRGDRYVVPVKQEYRNQFPGLVYDQSGSGATVFMEPLPLVSVMNDLAASRSQAHQEELRILEQLSMLVAAYHDEIRSDLEILGLLDFTFAKARLGIKMKGCQPEFGDEGFVVLRAGRHPLLKGSVVPLDLRLGREFDCLVITGPNTGGKSVSLKTLGLLGVMAQAGLHIPAGEGTVLPVFTDIYADIGDEQSIEQSLSTFSGHMSNIARILRGVEKHAQAAEASEGIGEFRTSRSLVLLDELGAGTDPEQGAALGMAIMRRLMQIGALVLATTHYSELKVFAHAEERAENASVEFDSETLRPTYKLSIGTPGESNAFEIAGRLNLLPEVIEQARAFLRPEQRQLSDLIRHLKEDQAAASEARRDAEHLSADARQLQARVRDEEERMRQKERDVLARAAREAQELVRAARSEAEQLIRALREEQRGASLEERRQAALAARSRLTGVSDRIEEQIAAVMPEPAGEAVDSVRSGDTVVIPRFNAEGYVLEGSNGGSDVLVQVGALKVNLPLHELRRMRGGRVPAKAGAEVGSEKKKKALAELMPTTNHTSNFSSLTSQTEVPHELHLRGLRVDEALEKVDKYLDSAYLAGLPNVNLIHGKGTGALRDALRQYLAQHPFVGSYRTGGYYEGGTGVTVVTFK